MADPAAGRWRLASPATANVAGGFAVAVVVAVIGLDVLGHEGNFGQGIARRGPALTRARVRLGLAEPGVALRQA